MQTEFLRTAAPSNFYQMQLEDFHQSKKNDENLTNMQRKIYLIVKQVDHLQNVRTFIFFHNRKLSGLKEEKKY